MIQKELPMIIEDTPNPLPTTSVETVCLEKREEINAGERKDEQNIPDDMMEEIVEEVDTEIPMEDNMLDLSIGDLEYVELAMAMKMSDRSSKTIRNWLKEGVIQGKKEDIDNPKSKWLIHRESLMGYLATSVEMSPPRRSGGEEEKIEQTSLGTPVDTLHTNKAMVTVSGVSQEKYDALVEENAKTTKQLEQFRLRIFELEKQLAISESKIEHKNEMISLLQSNSPNLEAIFAHHQRKLQDTQEELLATQKQLSIVQFAYEQEVGKGLLARIFTKPQELKMLPEITKR